MKAVTYTDALVEKLKTNTYVLVWKFIFKNSY